MNLKPHDIQIAYEYLAACPPFRKWSLPLSSNLIFKVTRSEMAMGEYDVDPHTIKVSSKSNDNWQQLIETVAHEMVHLECEGRDHYKHHEHDKNFKRLAARVCKEFGWDISTF